MRRARAVTSRDGRARRGQTVRSGGSDAEQAQKLTEPGHAVPPTIDAGGVVIPPAAPRSCGFDRLRIVSHFIANFLSFFIASPEQQNWFGDQQSQDAVQTAFCDVAGHAQTVNEPGHPSPGCADAPPMPPNAPRSWRSASRRITSRFTHNFFVFFI